MPVDSLVNLPSWWPGRDAAWRSAYWSASWVVRAALPIDTNKYNCNFIVYLEINDIFINLIGFLPLTPTFTFRQKNKHSVKISKTKIITEGGGS